MRVGDGSRFYSWCWLNVEGFRACGLSGSTRWVSRARSMRCSALASILRLTRHANWSTLSPTSPFIVPLALKGRHRALDSVVVGRLHTETECEYLNKTRWSQCYQRPWFSIDGRAHHDRFNQAAALPCVHSHLTSDAKLLESRLA